MTIAVLLATFLGSCFQHIILKQKILRLQHFTSSSQGHGCRVSAKSAPTTPQFVYQAKHGIVASFSGDLATPRIFEVLQYEESQHPAEDNPAV